MAAAELYDIFPCVLDAVTLNQLDDVDCDPGVEMLVAMAGGSVDPQLVAMAFADAKVKFTSRDLQAVLAGISPVNGLDITTQALIQFEQRKSGGVYLGDNNHVRLSATGGCVYIEEFGAEQDGKEGADVSLVFIPFFDGTNLPLVANLAQPLTGTPAANAVHALGPVVIEGQQLAGVQRVRVKTGIEVETVRADGELFARVGSIVKRAFEIEIEGKNLSILGQTGPFVLAIDQGATCYFQKVVPGGGRVGFDTAVHVAVSATGGSYVVSSVGGKKGENASTKITIKGAGTLGISTASTIVL